MAKASEPAMPEEHRGAHVDADHLRALLSDTADLAAVLDVDTTGQRLREPTLPAGDLRDTVAAVRELVPDAPATWVEHGDLRVAGQAVTWWVADDGTVHASTLDGLARGLAWTAGRWSDRWLLAAVLHEPERLDQLRAELSLDDREDDEP